MAQFVEDDEVQARQMIGEPALTSVPRFGLEAIDQIDHVLEAAARTGADAASGNGDSQMGLPVPVPPTRTMPRCCSMKLSAARS